jgi:hypothetical protein
MVTYFNHFCFIINKKFKMIKSMKNTGLFIFFSLFYLTTQATIRTVNNATVSAAQFTNLQDAINASLPNDTIYLHASPIIYPEVTVVKPIVIFGEGSLPDQQFQYRTQIERLNLYFSADYATNAGGSKIYGCKIDQMYLGTGNTSCSCVASGYATASIGVSDILIQRNQIGYLYFSNQTINPSQWGHGVHSNVSVINNIINIITAQCINSCLFANNIIRDFSMFQTEGLSHQGNTISNNTILGTMINVHGSQVVNNLISPISTFGSSTYITLSGQGNAYIRNVFTSSISQCYDCTSTFSENLGNVPSQVIQMPFDYMGYMGEIWNTSYQFLGPFPNFHIISGYQGINYGTDNTDVGIYGGAFPWVDANSENERFRYFAPPSQLPVLKEFNVLDPVVSPSGQMNIQFKAKSQN